MSSPVIPIAANSLKESVGLSISLIILSDIEPAIILPVIPADILIIPVDLPAIPAEIPGILPVAPEAEAAAVALLVGYELSEDSAESDALARPLSPDSFEVVVARWRRKVATRSSSSLYGSSSPSTLPTSPIEATVAPAVVPTTPICDTFAPVTGVLLLLTHQCSDYVAPSSSSSAEPSWKRFLYYISARNSSLMTSNNEKRYGVSAPTLHKKTRINTSQYGVSLIYNTTYPAG
ncbi:hypothetical protein Tco_0917576 [Tanacetum coccineum]